METIREIETEILRRTVEALLAIPGATGLNVDDGGDEFALEDCTDFDQIRDACFAVDECRVYASKGQRVSQWVFFVWGNEGWDAICDYTTNLEETLAPVHHWIETLEEL